MRHFVKQYVMFVLILSCLVVSTLPVNAAGLFDENVLVVEGKYNSSSHSITMKGELHDQNYAWIKGFDITYKDKSVYSISKKELLDHDNRFTYTYNLKKTDRSNNYVFNIDYDVDPEEELPGSWRPKYFEVYIHEFDVEKALKEKTIEKIRQKNKQFSREFGDDEIYLSRPQSRPPYKPGKLTKETLTRGLNSVKMMRYLAGLPYESLKLDSKINEQNQYGAVLLQRIGKLDHYPNQPKDMPYSFYEKGYDGTSSSNLCECGSSLGYSVHVYMYDTDAYNISHVGHRRWVLDTNYESLGFGLSGSYSLLGFGSADDVSTKVKWNYISWPAKGYMPIEQFDLDRRYNRTAWSISLNPEKYKKMNPKKITVEISKKGEKKVWKLNSSMNKYSSSKNYMNVSLENIGGPAIVFRPELKDSLKNNDTFTVKVKGLQSLSGKESTISYTVKFFKLKK